MERIARTRSTELFTLTVFVVALGVALLAAEVFDVSVALGAFFAGLVVGQSRFGPQAAADMVPFRDVFSALFFVSVGMLFNPGIVTSQPLLLAARARDRARRQAGRGARDRQAPARHAADGADRRRGPRADRRVLVHPRRPRPAARDPAGGGDGHPGRGGDRVDRGEPAALPRRGGVRGAPRRGRCRCPAGGECRAADRPGDRAGRGAHRPRRAGPPRRAALRGRRRAGLGRSTPIPTRSPRCAAAGSRSSAATRRSRRCCGRRGSPTRR